nr:MlaD family protein [Ferruginibacter sp. HRS2-29]
MKGKKLFSKSTTLYGVYGNVQGLQNSNPVIINGLQVGTVYKISTDKDISRIKVEFNITKDINIPNNSVAMIKPNPIGTTSVEIRLGDAKAFLQSGDSIFTEANAGVFNDILKKVNPVLFEVQKAVSSLDTLIININSVIDPRTKGNIASTFENLKTISNSMITSTAYLEKLLNAETGALAKTLQNMNSVTGNLAANNEKVTSVMTNLDKTTTKLSQLDLQRTLNSLDSTINSLQKIVATVDSKDGTLGKLINDPTLYQNLASTGNKLNLLLDDIRTNPKRYVSISVFGKKAKGDPLVVPTPDTLNSPYYIEKVPKN